MSRAAEGLTSKRALDTPAAASVKSFKVKGQLTDSI